MTLRTTPIILCLALFAGCAGGGEESRDDDAGERTSGVAPTGTDLTPDAGRSVVEIGMITDDAGNNAFEPASSEVRQGDVIRFVLRAGVHNAHFLPDSNPGARGLPAAGPLLQLPGQTYDVKVTWEEGRYYYQCDPHALLGMVGHITVRDDD